MRDKYYDEIKNNLINDETYSQVKDYSKVRDSLKSSLSSVKEKISAFN